MPVECGCVFVRDEAKMRETFSVIPPYLRDDRDMPWFSEYGIQQTRGFKALKLWLVIQHIGVDGFRELIQHDILMAKTLQAKIQQHPDFELIAAGELSITCFRYAPAGIPAEQLDDLNRDLALTIQREGQAFLTTTLLNNQRVLRVCIVNFRTTDTDLDILLNVLAETGLRLLVKN
jgi:glutamate/tyrosine decarboxylase-like PLP-dependent enzyme